MSIRPYLTIVAAGLMLAACSSSGGATTSGGATSNAAAPPAASAPAAAPSSVVVTTRSGPLGTYLTDSSGKTLYMFASDTSTKSSCSGQCLTYWPPLNGTPKAGSGVTASKLTTITGTNGAKQASYDGHPLYYYAADAKPGDITGQGSDNFGAKWWLLAPSGTPIETMPGSGSAPAGSAPAPSAPANSAPGAAGGYYG